MREDAFRAFLPDWALVPDSINSDVNSCRAIEGELGIDLDAHDLSERGLSVVEAGLLDRCRTPGLSRKSIVNHMSAVRSYAAFRGFQRSGRARRRRSLRQV